MRFLLTALAGLALCAAGPAPSTSVEFVDQTPKFLAFYAQAKDVADADARFALWKQLDGVAAVPPGPQGEPIARRLLGGAWSRYPAALPIIRQSADFKPQAEDALARVAAVLHPEAPVKVRVVAFVGGFEANAFTFGMGRTPVVNIPVEVGPERREQALVHELTHAVHMQTAGLSGAWSRSLAATVLQEGLAMHVTREVLPGLPEAAYVGGPPGWWTQAQAKRAAILADVAPQLTAADPQTVARFTFGPGPSGLPREAYAAGWFVVEALRAKGMTLAQIAAVKEADMPALVASVLPAA